MNSNFEYYKIFYYVAKYQNLTKAALALSTSQPAVTRTIHKLEVELGCRLFIRSKNGMQLTAEGKTFYEYVSAGCSQFFKGERNLSDLLQLEDGSISISATETALHCFLFQAIECFANEYPKVRFKILNNSSTDSVKAVSSGQVDMAIVSSSPFHMASSLKIQQVHSYQDVLIYGERFKKNMEKELSLQELSTYPWISLTAETVTRNFLNEYFESHELTFTPDIELATTDMILPAVRHNLGIGFIPFELAQADLANGVVHQVSLKEAIPLRHIHMIHDVDYPQSIAALTFRKFIQEELFLQKI